MRTRIVIIVVALVLGGLAAIFAARYLSSARSEIVEESEPVTVLVAAEDVPRGLTAEELLAQELLVEQEIPRQFVSADAVSSGRTIEGQVLAVPLAEGQQVTRSSFQYPSEAGLTYTIPDGQLAVTIPSDEIRGVAGFIKPGDFVSILVTFDGGSYYDEEGVPLTTQEGLAPEFPLEWLDWDLGSALPDVAFPAEYPITRIALPKVRVLAVERQVTRADDRPSDGNGESEGGTIGGTSRSQRQEEPSGYNSVTLAVSASQAEQVVFCQEMGSVWLALLGSDTEAPSTTGRIFGNAFME